MHTAILTESIDSTQKFCRSLLRVLVSQYSLSCESVLSPHQVVWLGPQESKAPGHLYLPAPSKNWVNTGNYVIYSAFINVDSIQIRINLITIIITQKQSAITLHKRTGEQQTRVPGVQIRPVREAAEGGHVLQGRARGRSGRRSSPQNVQDFSRWLNLGMLRPRSAVLCFYASFRCKVMLILHNFL